MITRLMRFFWWIGHSGTSAVMAAQFGLAMMPLWSRMRRALISGDRKSTRLNSSHGYIAYAVFRMEKKKAQDDQVAASNSLDISYDARVLADRGVVVSVDMLVCTAALATACVQLGTSGTRHDRAAA